MKSTIKHAFLTFGYVWMVISAVMLGVFLTFSAAIWSIAAASEAFGTSGGGICTILWISAAVAAITAFTSVVETEE